MNKELDNKLVKEFPFLYADRQAPMTQTLMCWGFSCGDGWYKIIYELSHNIEELIREWVNNNPDGDCICGCPKMAHPGTNECISTYEVPFLIKIFPVTVPSLRENLINKNFNSKKHAIIDWWRVFTKYYRHRIRSAINRYILMPLYRYRILVKKDSCRCSEYQLNHPRATQVKEKFGTLRFYMSSYFDEFFNFIDEAEKKSAMTCEQCGEPGTLDNSTNYWISTECKKCRIKNQTNS
jgi:hypothetical protein